MYKSWKRICALVLSLLLALSAVPVLAVPGSEQATGPDWEQVPNDSVAFRLGAEVSEEVPAEPAHAPDEMVRVSIELDAPSTLERVGTGRVDYGTDMAAVAYRDSLRASQDAIARRISAEALGGAKLDVVWNLTLAANLISANVRYGDIAAIQDVVGVRRVFLENRYEPMKALPGDGPMMSVATEMTGVQQVWSTGYTGAGSRVAVVDTGLDTSHQSFDAGAFDYAIEELNAERDEPVKLMSESDVEAVLDQLNAKKGWNQEKSNGLSSVTASDLYRTTKIPYAFNYVDSSLDVTHLNDTQGEHGSHVSGIATANRYIPDSSSETDYVEALEAVYTQGDAPDAQLLVMKVFGSKGGAYDSDYFAAIEDAIVLGADVVNLSLGSSVPGMVNGKEYAEYLSTIQSCGLVWANSAGNSYAWASFSNLGYLYADDVSYSTGGSPGTYEYALSVASVDNKGFTGEFLTVGDKNIFFNETSGYGNEPIHSIAGTHDYVLIDGFGTAEEWGDIPLTGKVALCSRGVVSFYEKANNAVSKGAKAVIIYNNQPGTISMNLTGYQEGYTAPVVSITQSDGAYMKSVGTKQTSQNGLPYYTGQITVAESVAVNDPGEVEYYEMSDFSSWGVPGDLSLKPEITAPGGNIYSVFGTNKTNEGQVGGTDQYENMSGTSMASPQIAGLTAVLAQYLREEGVLAKVNGSRPPASQLSQRQLMQSLMMSTAVPLREEDSGGEYYSIMKQGAGLIDLEAAVNARSYIMMAQSATKSAADGKIKVELGDDPGRENAYSATFTLYNFADEAQSFSLSADFFTQDVFDYEGFQYLDYWTTPLTATVSWTADGRSVGNALGLDYDFDGNGVVAMPDAQALLDKLTGVRSSISHAGTTDVDRDGDVDTHDVYALVELLNAATITVPKNGHATVTASFLFSDIEQYGIKGAYIEGFLYVREAETPDGALGVTHSIPVLGYYGSWTEPSMVDQGSLLDNWQGTRVEPYVASGPNYKSDNDKAFLVKNAYGLVRFLGGNPAVPDETYLPERNAINAADTLTTVRYTLIRNAVGSRVTVTGENGTVISDIKTRKDSYSAFFSLSTGTWNYAYYAAGVNFKPGTDREGQRITATLSLAPEYYLKNGSIDWDAVSLDGGYSVSFTVDSVAPTIQAPQATYDGGNISALTITASDNQFIAAIALLDENGAPLEKDGKQSICGADAQAAVGTGLTATFDLQEYFDELYNVPRHLLIQVYDYAGNLSTYRINQNPYEQHNDESVIEILPDGAELIVGKSAKLSAKVLPWGRDDQVSWTSDHPEIAAVDPDTGVVTGVSAGSCTVTATTVATPTVSANCTVTVFDRTLDSVIWSADGKVNFSEFTLSGIPTYTKLSEDSEVNLASVAYGRPYDTVTLDGVTTRAQLYAASFDTDSFTSKLYKVDEDSYALEEVTVFADLGLGAMDLSMIHGINATKDYLLCVYASFILAVDAEYRELLLTCLTGYSDFSDYIVPNPDGFNYLVGIAYAGQEKNSLIDWYWLLDMQGNIYKASFEHVTSGIGGIRNGLKLNGDVTLVCNLGFTVDMPYLQSLYYDGSDLYWTRYDTGENDVDLILVKDIDDAAKRTIYEVGSFENGVWPVGGLYQQGQHLKDLTATPLAEGDGTILNPSSDGQSVGEMPDFQAVRAQLMREFGGKSGEDGGAERVSPAPGSEPVGEESAPVPFPGDGTLDSLVARPQAVTVTDGTEAQGETPASDGVVHITADEAGTTNGLIRVSYNPAKLKLVDFDSTSALTSMKQDETSGTITFGFAVRNAESTLDKDGEILDLYFQLEDGVDFDSVQVETVERNAAHPGSEMTVLIGDAPGFAVTLDDRSVISKGTASTTLDTSQLYKTGDTFTVSCDLACVLAISTDQGETYQELVGQHVEGNTYRFTIPEVSTAFQIGIVLLGDARGDGEIKANDYTRISRYIAAQSDDSITTNCTLDPLTWLASDTRKDGNVKPNDSTRLSRYLAAKNDPSISTNCELRWKA